MMARDARSLAGVAQFDPNKKEICMADVHETQREIDGFDPRVIVGNGFHLGSADIMQVRAFTRLEAG
ncbi:hypothetical protein BL243_23080 [Ralstonia solanacearum]|nr:hypothetical protein BL243_23080 [Ralstonia solanacearum]